MATLRWPFALLAERVGFEPTVRLHARLISSQVQSTTLPPLHFGGVTDGWSVSAAKVAEHTDRKANRQGLVIKSWIEGRKVR